MASPAAVGDVKAGGWNGGRWSTGTCLRIPLLRPPAEAIAARARRRGLALLVASAALLAFGAAERAASAATCRWRATTAGDFNTGGNWDCGHVPTVADDVIFDGASSSNTNCTFSAAVNVLSMAIQSGSPTRGRRTWSP